MAGVNWGLQGPGFNALEALQAFGQAQQQGMQRQQMALKQQEMQVQVAARQRAGQQLGEGDFAGAAQTAAIGGDYDFAKFASSASDDHRKQLAEQAGLIGSLAVRLKGQPPEARAQTFAALAPQLAQRGFDQNELANVDLSDVGLDNYIAMATSADDALKAYAKSQQPFELSVGQTRYSADGQVIAQNAPLPKWQFDSESGSWLQEPGSGPAGYAAPQEPQAQPGAGGTFQRMIGAESGGRQFARNGQPLTSSAGAVGMAQVMPSTGPEAAKAAGLPWDPDRFRNDPEYNSRLGNAYYQKQLQAFNGDEAKAVAAYNAGPGRIRQAVLRSGDAWQESIPSETQGYLRKVLGGGQNQTPFRAPQAKIPGNLPLGIRNRVRNEDGSISTVRTLSIGVDGGEVLIPTVINNRVVSDDEAIRHYESTGENFGVFSTPQKATEYAQALHGYHERLMSGETQPQQGGQSQPGVVNVRPPKTRRNTDGAPSGYRYNGDRLEPIPGGPADRSSANPKAAQDSRKAEATFRKEFEQSADAKSFRTARTQFNALRETALNPNATAQDDIAVIFSFMKTLDPTSTVREGEFATAQNAGGVPENIRSAYQKALNGERLSPEKRRNMVRTAYRGYQSFRNSYNERAEQFRGYARDSGVNPDRVARTYQPDKPTRREPAPKADRMGQFTVVKVN